MSNRQNIRDCIMTLQMESDSGHDIDFEDCVKLVAHLQKWAYRLGFEDGVNAREYSDHMSTIQQSMVDGLKQFDL